jgi:adenosylcobinamide-GDP ribazoletransferase
MSGQSFRTTVRQQFNIFLAALMFMTRLPVGKGYVFRSEDLPRSAVYFPIVGAMIGSLGGLVLLCAEPFFPPVVAVLFCMGTTVLVTGALQ